MTYKELVTKIESMRRFGKKSGFEVSTELLKKLNYPEESFDVIHIAGTNGKGSTAAFISSILKCSDKRVGLFTSPHLITFRERIQINGEMISEEDVLRLGTYVLETVEQMTLEATMFDITMAIALLYFKEQGVEVAVLETGLGGGKDSTRALSTVPKVSVITNIGFDHTAVLGNTIEEIAKNKADIIRPGTSVVIADMDEAARHVMRKRCEELNVPFVCADSVELPKDVTLGLLGAYQTENAKNAVAAVEMYLQNGLKPEAKQKNTFIAKGLEEARWPGRMDVVSKAPFVLVDGAHNPQGVSALKRSLEELYPDEKFVFVVGVLADKDYDSMMEEMVPLAKEFVCVTVESDRALQAKDLAAYLNSLGAKACAKEGIKEAFDFALSNVTNEKIVAFGSLYFVGDVLQYF